MLPLHKMQLLRCNNSLKNAFQILRYSKQQGEAKNAGIIIIGDEILKAQVKETNARFMSKLLYKYRVRVKKISVISDSVDEIAKEIREFSQKYTYVITSGGIGPTHDDVTFEGLAKAFEDSLHYNSTLVDIIKNHFGVTDLNSPSFKMAYIPQKSCLKFGKDEKTGKRFAYPCLTLNNVYVFPGSPVFLEKSFGNLCKELFSSNERFAKDEIFINAREDSFAKALTEVSKEFPNVSFGSYPMYGKRLYMVKVTVESCSEEDMKRARQKFTSLLPPNSLVNCDTVLKSELSSKTHHKLYESTLDILRECYKNPERVVIYWDQSLESMVLLHLAHIVKNQLNFDNKLKVVYLENEEITSSVKDLRRTITERYELDGSALPSVSPQEFINCLKNSQPGVSTLLACGRKHEFLRNYNGDKSMSGMSVNSPIDSWTEVDLWRFIKSLSPNYVS